jgi:hypothetical protein
MHYVWGAVAHLTISIAKNCVPIGCRLENIGTIVCMTMLNQNQIRCLLLCDSTVSVGEYLITL